ncbi:hypothetical protein BDV06DRAFT_167344 [Aspergillus oleicola]
MIYETKGKSRAGPIPRETGPLGPHQPALTSYRYFIPCQRPTKTPQELDHLSDNDLTWTLVLYYQWRTTEASFARSRMHGDYSNSLPAGLWEARHGVSVVPSNPFLRPNELPSSAFLKNNPTAVDSTVCCMSHSCNS